MADSSVALLLIILAVTSALPAEQRIDINWPEDRPSFWPDFLPWPPALPEDAPFFWPTNWDWPPQIPSEWPEAPNWWPDSLPWPPAIPEQWPDQPTWWPDSLPWPPAIPEQWPDRPAFWPDEWAWPPALPEEAPSFWPEEWAWPPRIPDLPWPPAGINPDLVPYIPSRDNQFHLFTRNNQHMSQPLVFENEAVLGTSNYRGDRRTVVLVHDYGGSAIDSFNAILVPALLAAGDVNIIVVDWSAALRDTTIITTFYSGISGNFVARFLTWLSSASNGSLENFHLVGLGLGALNVGFIGQRCNRQIGYITALDPSRGHDITRLLPPLTLDLAGYFEVVHADGQRGYPQPLGHVDFYPNGGETQPGCGGDSACNRLRAVYFFAESVQTGGFTGVQCDTWRDALQGNCHGPGTLQMGGLTPKTERGIYFFTTNSLPPFARG